ncbi:MAG: transposase [Thermaceae bacterium]|nr:transposase [Thermaceae bacterium]
MSFPQGVKVEFEKGVLVLPKVGAVKAVYSRAFEGKFYVSVLVEEENQPSVKPDMEENAVGVDLGLKYFAGLSTGEKVGGGASQAP